MSDPAAPSSQTEEKQEIDPRNLRMIADVGTSLRRLQGKEDFDDAGLRVIWHRGKMRTEILTWESREGTIVKHELTFFGNFLEFSQKLGIRTGQIPLATDVTLQGKPTSELVNIDSSPSQKIAEYAFHLLRAAPKRDFYMQHLLKQLGDCLGTSSTDEARTVVATLDPYSRSARLSTEEATTAAGASSNEMSDAQKRQRMMLVTATLVGVGIGVGIVLALG